MASSAFCSVILVKAEPDTPSALVGLRGMVVRVNNSSTWALAAFDVASLMGSRGLDIYRATGGN